MLVMQSNQMSNFNFECFIFQVICPESGENVPDYFQLLDQTPTGLSANLNHGSFRAPEILLCYRRGRDRPPLLNIGVVYDGKDKMEPDFQVIDSS